VMSSFYKAPKIPMPIIARAKEIIKRDNEIKDELSAMSIEELEKRCAFCGSLSCHGQLPQSKGCALPPILAWKMEEARYERWCERRKVKQRL
jgi:hypothetical protein